MRPGCTFPGEPSDGGGDARLPGHRGQPRDDPAGALGPKGNATGGYFGQAFANITRRRLAGPGGVL
jgi:hypothetical protein